jgi:unsaturated rhamnogalacturonyl hydrolase
MTRLARLGVIAAVLVLAVAGSASAQAGVRQAVTPLTSSSAEVDPRAILRVMTAAADWQLAHPSEHATWDWTQAAFYTGMMAFAKVTDDGKYLAAMRAMGERNQWRPGLRPGHADDYAVIATYAQLYQMDRDPKMLEPAKALFNFLATRKYDESLVWGNAIETRELAWCDALFMGPPAMAAMTVATGDKRYLDLGNRLWWKTTDYLYDTEEHLYFRDSRFFEQRSANGRKIFWSRGNGWVIAGLVRVLDDMPENYPDRGKYVTLYREMAAKVASVQGADGYWRSGLLDPAAMPNPETSGTGFFVYALAWGVNRGVLDRATFEPVVRRGWTAMVKAVQPDGMLGWVQRIGYEPGATTADTTEVYGVGAFLLAGTEMHRLAGRATK